MDPKETLMKKWQARIFPLMTMLLVLASGMGVTLTMTPWQARAASTIPVTNKTGGGHQDVAPSAVVQTQSSFAPVTVAELISAINMANSNNADDVIDLGGQTFTLTAVGDTTLGANGLPAIQSDNGHKLVFENGRVERSTAGGTVQFRLFYISPGANLTLNRVTIANGAPPNTGIGRLGGGLFNQGVLTLNDCTVSGNFAIGGGIYNLANASAPTATVTINRCTISGNLGDSGGGISNGASDSGSTATLVVANSTIAGNSGDSGGGIVNFSGSGGAATMTLTNSTIAGNSTLSGGGGGGIYNRGTASIGGCIIARNSAMSSPDVDGSFTSQGFNLVGDATGSTGFNRTGDQTGTHIAPLDPGLELDAMNKPLLKDNGGPTRTIALLAGSSALDKGRITGRFCDQRGVSRPMDDPAIANFTNGDGTDIGAFEAITCGTGSTVVSNTDDSGAGSLRCALASAFTGSTITFNLTTPATITLTSGQLIIDKGVTIDGLGAKELKVQRNTADGTPDFRIFEIKTMVPVTINGLTIANGKATGVGFASAGGGIFNRGGVLTLNDCAVSGNSAANGAGGIANLADAAVPTTMLTLNRCTIAGNSVVSSFGGGISNGATDSGSTATLVIVNSTIAGNSGGFTGGGISNFSNQNLSTAPLTIINSTIAGNSAGDGGGGGISNSADSPVSIGGCIIARNSASAAPDVIGSFISQGYNLIGNASGSGSSFNQPTDQKGIDPKLELDAMNKPLLKDNGGPTPTIALVCGSPAIDKGNTFTASDTDQRGAGFPRIFDNSTANTSDGTDIGAFEIQTTCNQPPVAQCHNVTVSAGANCTASASINNGSSDPDAGDTISVSQSPAGPYAKGTTTVTLTVTDNHGATASCQATVTVLDSTAPTIACANVAAQSTNTNANCSALVPDVTSLVRAQSSDNCTAQASLVITQSPASGSTVSGTGSHPITVTVKDADNNETTCVVGFTLNDTTAPTINCPANITKSTDPNQCAAIVSFAPTATDNCSGVGTPTCMPPSGSSFPKGTTTVTCTVKDAANNQSAPCSFTITVNDTQAPVIVCPSSVTVPAATGQCSATVSYSAPGVGDNCPGVGAPLCAPPSGSSFAKGTTMVTCTVKDAANNQSACSFTITVVDTQTPTIVCPANIITNTVNAGDASVAVTFAAPAAADNCSGVTVACVPPSGSLFPRGTTTVTCTATDTAANRTSCSFTVRVFDYVIVDESNGRILRFVSTTGEYDYFDCRKNQSLSRVGVVTISTCKTTLTDVGPDAKHPDRNVSVTANPCTKAGSASVTYGGVTATLNDANLSNNIVRCP
jgi:hypothetical protein